MPETYDNELRGVLFSQEAETERHPNLTGKVQINGVEYRLAAWKRTSASGTNYLSLKVSEPEPQTVPAGNTSKSDEITDF